jgi:hypothetical protein
MYKLNLNVSHRFMKQCRWEAEHRSCSEDNPNGLCNTKVHYRVHNSVQVNPILWHGPQQ